MDARSPDAVDDRAPEVEGTESSPVDELSFKLTKPIQAHGDEISVLRWREPTAGDIERAGNPIVLEMFGLENPRLTFDEKKMSAMIAVLSAIPPSSVKQITAADWNTISWKLVRFFMPNMGA